MITNEMIHMIDEYITTCYEPLTVENIIIENDTITYIFSDDEISVENSVVFENLDDFPMVFESCYADYECLKANPINIIREITEMENLTNKGVV